MLVLVGSALYLDLGFVYSQLLYETRWHMRVLVLQTHTARILLDYDVTARRPNLSRLLALTKKTARCVRVSARVYACTRVYGCTIVRVRGV